jgi:hypothetical protein
MVFCTCQECKVLNIEAGGREVSDTTRWRHIQKENEWYMYLESIPSIEDPLIDQEAELYVLVLRC